MADVVEDVTDALVKQPDQGLKQTAKDLFGGAVGGVAQVLSGQPFDIVKVRLQTTTNYKGALDCASQILKNEGAAAFYKGTLTPLIGVGACVSVQFGGFHYARRAFEARNAAKAGISPEESARNPQPLSYGQYYAAGAFAGIVNTVLSSPIEHIRIRLQTQPHGAGRLYNGPIDCIRKLSSSPNVAKGLYRGTAVTFLREAQAYGCWFLAFEYLMQSEAKRNNIKRDQIPTWKVALYGGCAGEVLWISSYPLDVIKSKMQTDGFGEQMRYKSMRDAFAQTWRQEGAWGFWRGIGPTLLRAMPVSACTFAAVEMTMRFIN
ncbi:mitochondrial carrier domain-containing protein [Neohortaea acidophila]|uniref:Mitochondrial carrier domain-containing protein n=1 Tax=Neohortaea acidophila TaxID=245834 RepID=A0A6A6PQR8_9PEZI|nr:mitochondrial carrier domain-containing protein [Neohortaea acidophila]KAF2481974.1 mitochondrial carrier domain-containing protein [Neohortaea acidophila]